MSDDQEQTESTVKLVLFGSPEEVENHAALFREHLEVLEEEQSIDPDTKDEKEPRVKRIMVIRELSSPELEDK